MAKQGITWKDNVTPRLRLITPNIRNGMDQGVTESMSVSVQTIRTRVEKAVTRTGLLRASGGKPQFSPRPAWFAGRGPGRIESGRMLASARWQVTNRGAQIVGRGGFINAPAYTAKQELGDGQIPPMLAYAAGHTRMAALFAPTMQKYVERGLRYAQQGRAMGRDY